ncbi:MAG: hypothetical protein IPQ07_04205 [Myxococcales bacterium]|nr:hypothetical protein [Myxococcales bacterium]
MAHADPDPARTQTAMEDYFSGEKRGGLVLVGMGAAGLAAGGLLHREGGDLARGMSYPLLGFGVVHVAAGIFVNVASRRRITQFTDQIGTDPAGFVATERTRMKGVATTFTALKIVEVVLIAGGLTMAGIGHRTDRKRLEGVGYGVAIEAGLTLGFDIFAARRADRYQDELAAADVTTRLDAGGARIVMVSHGRTF